MLRPIRAAAVTAALALVCSAPGARAAENDTLSVYDPSRFGIVVSATKTTQPAIEVPNATAVVSGADLRRIGAHTLADALIDVVGVETGGGTDNGGLLPNIGMWGLKEFDALLITVDGVPVGGPFNPSLVQIPVDDIDRIEIVKGPQGTLYGMSAFAGMVQVFTHRGTGNARSASVGGGSFSNVNGRVGVRHQLSPDWALDIAASGRTGDGWQDRTRSEAERGRIALSGRLGRSSMRFELAGLSDRSDWGTPMPVDLADPVPGFERTANYAVGGATQSHAIISLGHYESVPLTSSSRFENTLNFTRDHQESVRNFFSGVPDPTTPDTVSFAGVQLKPIESTFYDDARLVTTFEAGGPHELVTGAAVTWGRTTATGIGFDVDERLSAKGTGLPGWEDIPVGDHRSFEDQRTFFGVYAHDSWTPARPLTIAGGGRWDHAHEKLHAFGQEVGDPNSDVTDDAKTSEAWSGDLSALVRLLPAGSRHTLNVYGNWKSSFKPAAPNLTEAENAHILDPERTHAIEGGLKGSLFEGQVTFDAGLFQMDFLNMVVGAIASDGSPVNVNAGHERFKGTEASLTLSPNRVPGLSLTGGWANHDPRFVSFSFFADPADPASLTDIGGAIIEVAPRQMWNMRASYAPAKWLGAWVAARHEDSRPMKRRKQYIPERWTPPFSEYDAGVSLAYRGALLTVAGRNLGDDRHWVAESDIGDSQFYYAPPKRYTAEIAFPF
jgi:outer membrane receptor protein involved in Fe transport